MNIPKELCPICEGKGGQVYGVPSADINNASWTVCNKCQGFGKLDWVEMIMGKKERTFNDYLEFLDECKGKSFKEKLEDVNFAFKVQSKFCS